VRAHLECFVRAYCAYALRVLWQPLFLSREHVTAEALAKERSLIEQQALESGRSIAYPSVP
jgi:hypothetical protein